MLQELSEQEELRRSKLVELRKLNINPYPAEEFKINVTALDIKENYERDKLNYKDISIAADPGRHPRAHPASPMRERRARPRAATFPHRAASPRRS